MKRLKSPTGRIFSLEAGKASSDKLVKRALLIHSGENGSKISLESAGGEISFDSKRIKNIVKQHNDYIKSLENDYGGAGKMPIGAFPPILDQHEDESIKRVCGRLASYLDFEVRDVPGVGKNCACVCSDITFLDGEIIEMVEDGRVYHLSIGIDENTDTLTETSLVITPAAPGAMLLKKGKSKMGLKQKRLEAHQKRKTALSAIKDTVKNLSAKVVKANDHVKLAKKEGQVTHRLTGLMRSGKITPAEFKKMDVKKLAKLPDAELNTVIETFAALEPKVLVGQRGSTAAMNFSSIGKAMEKKQIKNLKSEIKKDIARLTGKKLKAEDEDEKEDKHLSEFASEETKKLESEHEVEGGDHLAKHLEAMKKMGEHLEAGQLDEAKLCHAEAMKHLEQVDSMGEKKLEMGDENHEAVEKNSNELQTQIDELSSQLARVAGMVDELFSVEEEEGHDLEKEEDEDEKHLEDDKDEKEKDEKNLEKDEKDEKSSKELSSDEEKEKVKKELNKKGEE